MSTQPSPLPSGLRSQLSGLRSQLSSLPSGLRSQLSSFRSQVSLLSALRSQVSSFRPQLSLLLFPLALFAQPSLPEIRQELEGPLTVVLEGGNRQTGQLAGWDGDTLRLSVDLGGGGRAQLSYTPDEIRRVNFPGREYLQVLAEWMQDPARAEDAFELFNAFYRQQVSFFQFLEPADFNLYLEYVRFAIANDQPLRAVALIDTLRPFLEDPERLQALDESILLAFFQADLIEEAGEKAREWTASAPTAGPSALGWRVLSELQFREEAYEEALWTALYPIAFANQILPEHLDICYALAIAAARETRQHPLAERLGREMQTRGLDWPSHLTRLEPYQPTPIANQTEDSETEEAIDPIQSPSPLDPMQSLPTRIRF